MEGAVEANGETGEVPIVGTALVCCCQFSPVTKLPPGTKPGTPETGAETWAGAEGARAGA